MGTVLKRMRVVAAVASLIVCVVGVLPNDGKSLDHRRVPVVNVRHVGRLLTNRLCPRDELCSPPLVDVTKAVHARSGPSNSSNRSELPAC